VKTDLKFIIKQLEHDTFQRQGNDLVLVKKIHLVTALAAEALDIVTLDKRVLTISFDEIISPRTIKLIQNEGMPNQFKKGKLILKFHIEFPKFLPDQSKQALIEVLT
jgi:DnaJ-class molecular chaperone